MPPSDGTSTASWTDHGRHVTVVMTCATADILATVTDPDAQMAFPFTPTVIADVIAWLESQGIDVPTEGTKQELAHYNELIHMSLGCLGQ